MEKIALSVAEAAKVLSISKTKMYELVRTDGFPAVHIGGRIVIHARKLEEWISERIGE